LGGVPAADATTGIACQLLFCRREDGEILVDLLALDPLPVDGDVLVPGTPLTLGLTDPGDCEAGDALVALLDGWADKSSVCRVHALHTDRGQRLCIAADGDRLVIDVDGRSGLG
jgi:hypothetical protein